MPSKKYTRNETVEWSRKGPLDPEVLASIPISKDDSLMMKREEVIDPNELKLLAKLVAKLEKRPDPKDMPPGQINKEIEWLNKEYGKILERMVLAGRESELNSETHKKTDPLSMQYRAISERRHELKSEGNRRMGPGYWTTLPSGAKPLKSFY